MNDMFLLLSIKNMKNKELTSKEVIFTQARLDDGGDADGNSNGGHWRAFLVMLPCMPEARALDGLNYIRVYLR